MEAIKITTEINSELLAKEITAFVAKEIAKQVAEQLLALQFGVANGKVVSQRAANLNPAQAKRYVYGLRGIRELFNVSLATAQRYKNTFLAPAIYQQGRKIVVDADLAMRLFNDLSAK